MAPRGQSFAQGLLNREIGRLGTRGYVGQQWQQADHLSKLHFEARPTTVPLPPAIDTAGLPIVAKFNKNPSFSNCQLLAVGGEEGVVTIVSTEDMAALEKGAMDGSWRPRAHWTCHRNSIFDLAWAKSDSVLYTASGHQQVGVWDTDTARALAVAEGHDGSVKCISPLHLCEDVFATGARDGRMSLWDARCPGFSCQGATAAAAAPSRRMQTGTDLDSAPVISPVWVQENAHTRPGSGAAGSRISASKIAKPAAVTVTSVAFVPYSYLLASSGAHDPVVKLWDLRMHGLPLCDLELSPRTGALAVTAGRASGHKAKTADAASKGLLPHEVGEFTCPTRASAVGVTHLAISESGDRLLVSCLDSQHHLYSLSRIAAGPLATWRAPPPAFKGSFYMRSAFSPCGDYILCGSRDCGAHIWRAAEPQQPPIALPHEHEVTGVAWCHGEWGKVATCSDSGEVRVWTLSRLPAREVTGRAAEEEEGIPVLRESQSAAASAPVAATASHVAALELDAEGTEQRDGAEQQQHKRAVAAGTAGQAGPSSTALPVLRAAGPAPNRRMSGKPVIRRTIQLRLNLQRIAPVPSPPPAAFAAPPPSAAGERAARPARTEAAAAAAAVPLFSVMEAPGAASVHAAIAAGKDVFLLPPGGGGGTADGVSRHELLDGKSSASVDCAAAVRAPAFASPVSSASVQPAPPATTGPASVARRPGFLPPVPIFSPAVNCWQQQQPVRPDFDDSGTPIIPLPPAPPPERPLGADAGPGTLACGGLEAAMKGLAHVRTQSPARTAQQYDDYGSGRDTFDAFAIQGGGPGDSSNAPPDGHVPLFSKLLLPAAAAAAANSFPPPTGGGGSQPAARAPAVSPRTTPASFNRSRSRLGPFSPLCSSASSGGNVGPFSCFNSLGRCGGSGDGSHSQGGAPSTPTVSQRHTPGHSHQPPQGVIDQILRNSPRLGSRTSTNGGAGLGAMLSPRFRRASVEEEDVVMTVGAAEGVVQRRLFGTAADGKSDGTQREGVVAPPPRDAFQGPCSGTDFAAAVSDLEHPGSGRGGDTGAARTLSRMSPSSSSPPLMYDIQDGQDVGPALRYRAAHPDDIGPYVDGFFDDGPGGLTAASAGGAGDRSSEAGALQLESSEIAGLGLFFALEGFESGVGGRNVPDMVADGSDSDSDWDFDPYGDKENTPPPEPLPAAAPTSSGSLPFVSPRNTHPGEEDQPLLLGPAPSTPTRANASVTAVVVPAPTTPSELRRARMATPFAAALPFPSALDPTFAAAAAPGGSSRRESDPTLNSEPTVSAGILPGSGGGRTSSGTCPGSSGTCPSSGSADDGGGGGGDMDEMPSFDLACWRVAGSGGEISARQDHLTPTKRPRRVYSSGEGHSADRSPSPTRRVRSTGPLAAPAPTPRGKHRPGVGGGYAAVMASPCVRHGGRPGGGSRLAPAPGAGVLVTAAFTAAAGIGSESPMPKTGTASRTGGRHTVASEDYFRRRADEERNHGVMSPFGFGMFVTAESATSGRKPRTVSCMGLGAEPAAAEPLPPGAAAAAAGVGDGAEVQCIRGDGGPLRPPSLPLPLPPPGQDHEHEEPEPEERSVRSLLCVFETETRAQTTQGGGSTLVVPCTFPEEVVGVEGEEHGEGEQARRLVQQMPLTAFEERTFAAFPATVQPPDSREGGLAGDGVDGDGEGGYFEPGAAAGGPGRQRSFRFANVFDAAVRPPPLPPHPQQQQQQHSRQRGAPSQLAPAGSRALSMDENSQSFPAGGSGGLQTALSGQGVAMSAAAQSATSVGAGGLHALLALSSGPPSNQGPSSSLFHGGREPQQLLLPTALRAFPRLGAADAGGGDAGGGGAQYHRYGATATDTAEQQQLLLAGALLRRHRQQTLQQCWGSRGGGSGQRDPTPAFRQMALPTAPVPPPSGSRWLGPTGLTSPKYFR